MTEKKPEQGCLSGCMNILVGFIIVAVIVLTALYVVLNLLATGANNKCWIGLSDGCIARKYEQCINSEQFTSEQCKIISELGK